MDENHWTEKRYDEIYLKVRNMWPRYNWQAVEDFSATANNLPSICMKLEGKAYRKAMHAFKPTPSIRKGKDHG
jgi:hypothetical protein